MKKIVLCIGLIGLGLSGVSTCVIASRGDDASVRATSYLPTAAGRGDISEVRRLLQDGAECTVSALMHAVESENIKVLTKLLNNGGRRCIDNLDGQGETVLIVAVKSGKPLSIIRLLLDNGAGVDRADQTGKTALMWAAGSGNIDSVNLLLNRGANISIRSRDGLTALGMAVENSHSEIANLLCDRGA